MKKTRTAQGKARVAMVTSFVSSEAPSLIRIIIVYFLLGENVCRDLLLKMMDMGNLKKYS